jgi:DNA-binding XRE family transcriptional regulator
VLCSLSTTPHVPNERSTRQPSTGRLGTVTTDRNHGSDLAVWLGQKLREAREEAGIASQELLARELGFHRSVIVKAETGSQPASKTVAPRIQERFPGLCNRLYVELCAIARKSNGPIPGWITDWLEREAIATSLRVYQPFIVPGLLQTADYARELYKRQQPWLSDDELDDILKARLDRRAILDKPDAPEVIVILDEAVLHRLIGSPKIMHDQIVHLIEMSERPNILIHIVPSGVGAHAGLSCAYVIGSVEGEPDMMVVVAVEDQTIKDPEVIRKAAVQFNLIHGDALSRGQSRSLMQKVDEEKWNAQTT